MGRGRPTLIDWHGESEGLLVAAFLLAKRALEIDGDGTARFARGSSRRSEMFTLLNEGARGARACGKLADAATWLEELLVIAESMPDKFPAADLADIRFRLGSTLLRMNRPDDAARHLQTAVDLAPALAKAWFFLGLAQQSLHHPAARDSLERACELEPENNAWREHLALMADAALATR